MTMKNVDTAWPRTVARGDDLYTARPVENNPSLCEIGRFTRHEWRDGDGSALETWDPVGTAVVPKHSDMPEWWVAAIGLVRLGRLLTEKDVRMMVYRVDERLRPHLDPDDLEEGEDVYRLGDWGYVRAGDFERAFEGEPEWARDMYMLDGNEPENDGRWADAYNRGGVKALGEELNRMFDEDRADHVFYTTAEAPVEDEDEVGRYRLSYDEVSKGLIGRASPATGLPAYEASGDGFHTRVWLERYDRVCGDWDAIDSESVDGLDAEASEPYDAAERRVLARNGLDGQRVEVVAPWGTRFVEPQPANVDAVGTVATDPASPTSIALSGMAPTGITL